MKSEDSSLEVTGSKVRMIYHFFHKLLDAFTDKPDFGQFDWFLDNERTMQRLYLSRDANKMCEVIQNKLAVVWKKGPECNGELIEWKKDFRIAKFPFIAAEVCSLPFFLSDDFEFMCDYNYRRRNLRVLKTRTKDVKNQDEKEENSLILNLPR